MRWPGFLLLPLLLVACTDQQPADPDLGDGPVFNNGAVVVRGDIGCGVIDGNGDWFPPTLDLPCGTEVAVFNDNLNAKVTVQASGAPNPTGRTVHWGPYNPGRAWVASYPELDAPPYPCYVLGTDRDLNNPLFTVNWKATVTPSGEATLVCHYKKQWEFQWPSP